MANFVTENFTAADGTTLQSLTGWVRHASSDAGNMVISDANRTRPGQGGSVLQYYNSASAASADYSVSVDVLIVANDGSTQVAGVLARMDTTASTWYTAYLQANGVANQAVMHLRKAVAGTGTELATSVALVANVSDVITIKLECIGTAIKAYKNGALLLSATDSDVAAAGKAGIVGYATTSGNTAGWHIDNLSGDDTSGGATILEEDGEWIITTQSW